MRRALALAALLALLGSPAPAQVTLSNLLEAQSGRDPFSSGSPKNRYDVYEQLQLEYLAAPFTLGLRFEADHNSSETADYPGYQTITQRFAEWTDRDLRLRVGNFQTILGRGLIHRSFELSGVIHDQGIFPSRYVLTRDVDGVLAEGDWGPVGARLFSGRPNGGEFSPAVDDLDLGYERYTGLVSGAQGTARVWRDARIGAAYARYSSPVAVQSEYGTGFLELDPLRMLGIEVAQAPLYVEYARKNPDWDGWRKFTAGTRDTAALYASGNLIWGPLAFSAEWKHYRAMNLGTNAPPSLVREHGFPLLNRITHFLQLSGEKGFQLEASWALPGFGDLTVNHSRADGDIGSSVRPRPVRFDERYAELHIAPPNAPTRWEATFFVQDGQDGFESIRNRHAIGGGASMRFRELWSMTIDLEELEATRYGFLPTSPTPRIVERYASVQLARADWGSAAVVWERTNDPVDEDPHDAARTPAVEPNTFFSTVVSARISERHEVKLFAGERRRGLACTAGTCYVVQPFRGVELRITTRL